MTRRRLGRVLIDLLASTNKGPVSIDIIRGVLWNSVDREPEDWSESIRHLAYETNREFGVSIRPISLLTFKGYRLCEPADVSAAHAAVEMAAA